MAPHRRHGGRPLRCSARQRTRSSRLTHLPLTALKKSAIREPPAGGRRASDFPSDGAGWHCRDAVDAVGDREDSGDGSRPVRRGATVGRRGYPVPVVDELTSDGGHGSRSPLGRRVAAAARELLDRRGFVAPVEVLIEIGWLALGRVEDWRRGRVEYLEQVAAVGRDRLDEALRLLEQWVSAAGLRPDEVAYVAGTRDRRVLRFTAEADPRLERAYRTHHSSPQLSENGRRRLVETHSRPPDLVVFSPTRDWVCDDCGDADGGLLVKEDDRALCLACADMDHLVFLSSGDAALTRRAKTASTLAAVVVRFSHARKRYERQGILVEPAALEAAEQQCLGDEQARQRRRDRDRLRRAEQDMALVAATAEHIRRLFPRCPRERAEAIAAHTGQRGSGRVGRTAAGRALADEIVTLAIVASVRHEDTRYDQLLMAGIHRSEARELVRADIDRVLDSWR